MNDQELLRHFVETGSGSASAELVRRHQDMVFAVCLRRLEHRQLAQDAAQLTFLALFRKARELMRHECPAAWLHRTATLEAKAIARKESNRQRYEQAMPTPQTSDEAPGDVRLHELDEALLELRELERQALLLRFFEGHSLRELGDRTGVSAEAARKRVDRALSRLAEAMGRRAPACSVAGVLAMIEGSSRAAPPELAPAIVTAASQLPVSLTTVASLGLAAKLKLGAACTVAASLPVVWFVRENQALRQENLTLRQSLTAGAQSRGAMLSRNPLTVQAEAPPVVSAPAEPDPAEQMRQSLLQAFAVLFAAESRQVDASRAAKLVEQAGLNEEQQAAARGLLETYRAKREEGLASLLAGQVTLTRVQEVLRTDLMAAEACREVLTPAQIPAYEAFLAGEKTAFAESHANAEVSRLHALLNLTDPQKDSVFSFVASRAEPWLTLCTGRETQLGEILSRWEKLQEEEVQSISPLLDETQRAIYEKQAFLRRDFVRHLLTPAAVSSADHSGSEGSLVSTAAPETVPRTAITTLAGDSLDLPVPAAKATVLIFTSTTCPLANGFAPELRRIDQDFRGKGVSLVLVHLEAGLSGDQARQHTTEYGFTCPVTLDPGHALVKLTGATVTPEAVVLSPEGRILYRGRIDDRFREVGARWQEPTELSLRNALTAVLEGGRVSYPWPAAKGCFIE